MNSIVIGMGQIGTAVKAVTESKYSLDSATQDRVDVLGLRCEVMHVCIPYSDNFVAVVRGYCELIKPKHVAVWSTVPIGTCGSIDARIVHTPVEGRHPDLELSVRQMERWIGANDEAEGKWFAQYFHGLGLRTRAVSSSKFTEALKLISTTEYGVNIEFARYKKQIAHDLEMDYELMKQWNAEYNRLYQNLGLGDRFQKFVLDAPEGPKGGHCVTPNARLLYDQYPDEMVKTVGEL